MSYLEEMLLQIHVVGPYVQASTDTMKGKPRSETRY